ncbi:MAG: substrate-binding domain-containing protein [Pseudorhodoplanes sp.]
MRLFTTSEAAEYLRIKERKLYELVSEGAIPCTKATGKWLFPKDELDRWLCGSLTRPDGMNAAEPMPIIGGSHDPLMEWALRESRCGLATLPEGSSTGLQRFMAGKLVAAAIHLHAQNGDRDANIETMRYEPNLHQAVLIGFARREQGIVVAAGNPLGLSRVHDLASRHLRLAVRPAGAGAQLLLEALLHRERIDPASLNVTSPPCPTGSDIAQAIRTGRADAGIATRSVANAAGLDFVSLTWERFDLVVSQREYFRPPMQIFLSFLRTETMQRYAGDAGGYDISTAGEVRYAP